MGQALVGRNCGYRVSIIMRSVRESDWKYRQSMNQFIASGKPFSCEECPAEMFLNDPGGAEIP